MLYEQFSFGCVLGFVECEIGCLNCSDWEKLAAVIMLHWSTMLRYLRNQDFVVVDLLIGRGMIFD